MITLESKVEKIPRIGDWHQKKLNKIGIYTAADLLWHFPARYEDFSNICPIAKIKPSENCCVCGKVLNISSKRSWTKRGVYITEALVADDTGTIRVVWFWPYYMTKNIKKGDNLCLAGKFSAGSLSSPNYEKISEDEASSMINDKLSMINSTHTARLVPIYPETAGLTSRWLRYILKPLLQNFKGKLPEPLPQEIIKGHELLDINSALQQMHFPHSQKQALRARDRFSFEDLFLVELSVLKARLRLNKQKAPPIPFNVGLIQEFVKSLPFKLTDAQRKCAYQILKNTEENRPMSRLLEGDVGSGKTVVAVIAALNTVKAGYQVAFMAPTEILAKQHFKEVSKVLWPLKVKVALLTGKQDQIISQKLKNELIEISRQRLLEKAKNGELDILIGTHALIQDKVSFGKLGLAIIDEQHRFGVEQRAKLCQDKAQIPHLLSMTATPIPRTLALTVYGDLDLSIIDEMPKGRKTVITKVVPPQERKAAYEFIAKEVKQGRQVFVICPRIEPGRQEAEGIEEAQAVEGSESNSNASNNTTNAASSGGGWTDVKAVKEEYKKLSEKIFCEFKVEMLHGKLKTKEKETIMKNFKAGKIDIVVSTSVVEVGVDIPKATVMMIEGADKFGLAQLYQFRGRVGRSDLQSYCFLFTESSGQKTRQRLSAIVKAKNGFELAEKDLEIRGPGALYGTKQWGMPDLAMENLSNLPLVEKTREAAKELLRKSPNLTQFPFLLKRLAGIEKRLHLE